MPVRKLMVGLCFGGLVACSTPALPPTSAYAPESPPLATEALLYIVRPAAQALSGRVARFELDSRPIAELHSGTYAPVRVRPGSAQLRQIWLPAFGDPPALAQPLSITLRLTPGGTHYAVLEALAVETVTRWDLKQVPEVQGEKRIVNTRRLPAAAAKPQ